MIDEQSHSDSPQMKPAATISRVDRNGYEILLVLMIALTVIIRLRLLDIPLERDEGEFAYMGQLMLQGIPPYQLSYNLKFPGIYAAYALIMFGFGQTTEGIHLGFLFVNVATILLVFLLGARLFDRFVGLIAACSFAILSLSPTVNGTSAHATHFVMLPVLLGILLMLKSIESDRMSLFFWSGLFLGVSVLMKQPAVFFALFSCLYILHSLKRLPDYRFPLFLLRGGLFWAGVLIPLGIMCVMMYASGVFDKFFFWTFAYASQYGSKIPVSLGWEIFLDSSLSVIGQFYMFYALAVSGMGFLLLNKSCRHRRTFVAGFFFFSFIAVCPGFYFRPHYFILLLPALSLLIGIGIGGIRTLDDSRKRRMQTLAGVFFIAVLIHVLYQYKAFFFEWTPMQACRSMYGINPFPESIEIASYIKSQSEKEDRVAVFGSEPQLYFLADRHSATGYIYTYALMEEHKYAQQMQKEMMDEVERAKPRFLVFVNALTSWLPKSGSDRHIFRWLDAYSSKYYDLTGVVEIASGHETIYRWGEQVWLYPPRTRDYLLIYKRKIQDAAPSHAFDAMDSRFSPPSPRPSRGKHS